MKPQDHSFLRIKKEGRQAESGSKDTGIQGERHTDTREEI